MNYHGMQEDSNRQRIIESHIIGESLHNHKVLDCMRQEDFHFFREEFHIIRGCQGNIDRISDEYLRFYKIQDQIVWVALDIDRVILYLAEKTFYSTLQRTLSSLRGNTPELTESVLYDDLLSKIKDQDVFDLIECLPEYMDSISLPNDRIKKWVEYCESRIKNIKKYLDGIK